MRKLLAALFLLLLAAQAGAILGPNSSLSNVTEMVEIESGERRSVNTTGEGILTSEGLEVPAGFLVLVLAFLAIVVYTVDFDPIWVAVLLFTLFLAVIVSRTAIPEFVVPLLFIIMVAGVRYL